MVWKLQKKSCNPTPASNSWAKLLFIVLKRELVLTLQNKATLTNHKGHEMSCSFERENLCFCRNSYLLAWIVLAFEKCWRLQINTVYYFCWKGNQRRTNTFQRRLQLSQEEREKRKLNQKPKAATCWQNKSQRRKGKRMELGRCCKTFEQIWTKGLNLNWIKINIVVLVKGEFLRKGNTEVNGNCQEVKGNVYFHLIKMSSR